MCGRYTLSTTAPEIEELLGVTVPESSLFPTRWNIAPTQQVPAVRLGAGGQMEVSEFRWGLVPTWAKDIKIGASMINARSETVATKPAFRSAFKRRRCLVLASGYYEWQHSGKTKTPYLIEVADEPLFTFAGLWESWGDADSRVESVTIITCEPNERLAALHDRMPVILGQPQRDLWLSNDLDTDAWQSLLVPYPSESMTAREVSREIGNVRFTGDPRL